MLPGREKKTTEWLVIIAEPATRKGEGSLSKSVNICSTVSPPAPPPSLRFYSLHITIFKDPNWFFKV